MKRHTLLCAAVLTLLSSVIAAQSRDFNGTWIMDKERSTGDEGPPQFTVVMTATTLTMTPPETAKMPPLVFTLDGKETLRGGLMFKAEWKNDKLETTIGGTTITWSREGAFLVHEGPMKPGDKPSKIYYKKAGK